MSELFYIRTVILKGDEQSFQVDQNERKQIELSLMKKAKPDRKLE